MIRSRYRFIRNWRVVVATAAAAATRKTLWCIAHRRENVLAVAVIGDDGNIAIKSNFDKVESQRRMTTSRRGSEEEEEAKMSRDETENVVQQNDAMMMRKAKRNDSSFNA